MSKKKPFVLPSSYSTVLVALKARIGQAQLRAALAVNREMVALYKAWELPDRRNISALEVLPQAVAELPWGHNALLLEKLKDRELRLWYARMAREQGWSRSILSAQIKTRLHERLGSAQTNFSRTLPPPQSDLAHQTLKDPYIFDFLTLTQEVHERELEQGLMDLVQRFLLELGTGFAFVGRQVHLEVGGDDFYPPEREGPFIYGGGESLFVGLR